MQPFITKGCIFFFLFVDKEGHFTKPVEHSLQQVYNPNEKNHERRKTNDKTRKRNGYAAG